jgi:hypothetical protein
MFRVGISPEDLGRYLPPLTETMENGRELVPTVRWRLPTCRADLRWHERHQGRMPAHMTQKAALEGTSKSLPSRALQSGVLCPEGAEF